MTCNYRPKHGEIWMCRMPSKDGSVQSGYRPVFIISNDINNAYSPIVNVVPLTSRAKKHLPVHVELENYKSYGLPVRSTMLIEQITTVSVDNIDKYIGKVTDINVINDIYKAMMVQFPILGCI